MSTLGKQEESNLLFPAKDRRLALPSPDIKSSQKRFRKFPGSKHGNLGQYASTLRSFHRRLSVELSSGNGRRAPLPTIDPRLMAHIRPNSEGAAHPRRTTARLPRSWRVRLPTALLSRPKR